jgi:hypothetical protein
LRFDEKAAIWYYRGVLSHRVTERQLARDLFLGFIRVYIILLRPPDGSFPGAAVMAER